MLLALGGCAEGVPVAAQQGAEGDVQVGASAGDAQLFAHALADIAQLYVDPVSVRRVALSGAAQLSGFDHRLVVTDHLAGRSADALTLLYDNRDIADFAMPARDDERVWGEQLALLVAAARQASPPLAAVPPERVADAVFDGFTAALDPFSRYVSPTAARADRAARDGLAAPTVTVESSGEGALVLRIVGFNRGTAQRVAEAIEETRRRAGSIAGIVLDLRGNPGGLLDQAVELAGLFIADGAIASTVGRQPASDQYFAASAGRGAVAPGVPVVMLVNGGSASSAEIVATALQDAGRAVVIGSSSYGKGTVQTVLRLPNNGELILTWARLKTRSGYALEHHGVVPTLCTADLPDDAAGAVTAAAAVAPVPIAVRLQQAAAVSFAVGPRPRATLDEAGWTGLRRTCPPRPTRPAIDLALAERLLAAPSLYAEALQALPAATQVAQGVPASPPPR